MRPPAGRSRSAWLAAAGYLVLTLAMTWPVARTLARNVAWDLGDSLLNMWILSWDAEQLKAILGGDLARIRTFFDANIFHPEPRTLAYSEHLFAQALQIFPIYLATGNPILCYNLLFLSTFVLCGIGMFLLVRELTGHAPAAFLAGLIFAFAPYRIAQASHLQVLSVQWMPFVLYGFRRYVEFGRRRALAGAAAALVAQNLSCGYYLLYFAPLAGVYVAWELTTRARWRDRQTWIDLGIAAAAVIACTLPFVLPYKRVRDTLHLSRDVGEITRFSADVYSYLTAFDRNRAWGSLLRAYPKGEGELFPGIVPAMLGLIAIGVWIFRSFRLKAEATPAASGVASGFSRKISRWIPPLLGSIAVVYACVALVAIFERRIDLSVLSFPIRATNITRLIIMAALAAATALAISPAARPKVAWACRQPEAIFLIILAAAWWLSLGPSPRAYGRPIELWSPYRLLLDFVPGYEGVRVPARFAMIVALALAVLAGLAAARLPHGRIAIVTTFLVSVAFLVESQSLPFLVNGTSPLRDFATPEARVYRPASAPMIYRDVARVRPDAVVLEMPFGEPEYDLRAVYYSTVHWRKLVNGYSGFFPPHYSRLAAVLAAVTRDDMARLALDALGVTHVVIHEAAYLDDEGARFTEWLRRQGAVEVSRRGTDVLWAWTP